MSPTGDRRPNRTRSEGKIGAENGPAVMYSTSQFPKGGLLACGLWLANDRDNRRADQR